VSASHLSTAGLSVTLQASVRTFHRIFSLSSRRLSRLRASPPTCRRVRAPASADTSGTLRGTGINHIFFIALSFAVRYFALWRSPGSERICSASSMSRSFVHPSTHLAAQIPLRIQAYGFHPLLLRVRQKQRFLLSCRFVTTFP